MRIESLEGRALFVATFGSEFVCADLPADGAQQTVTFLPPVHAAQTAALNPALIGTLLAKSPAGTLSAYETGFLRDAATISGGPGGKSYGLYSLSSRTGTLNRFTRRFYREEFKGLRPGTTEFDAKWTSLAAERPAEFRGAQQSFIEITQYDVLAGRLDRRYGEALSGRSEAFGEVIWAVSVQHGPKTPLVQCALEPFADAGSLATADDGQLIDAIYREREREDRSGNLVYFPRSSEAVQDGLRDRFEQERADALAMLASDPAPTPTPPPPTGPTPTPTPIYEPTPTPTVHLDAPQAAGSRYGLAYQDADAVHTRPAFIVFLNIEPVTDDGFGGSVGGYGDGFFAYVTVEREEGVPSWPDFPAPQALERTLDENGVSTYVYSYGGPGPAHSKLTVTVSVSGNYLTGRWHITPAEGQPYDPATMDGSVVPPAGST